jgi:hypothetical protein
LLIGKYAGDESGRFIEAHFELEETNGKKTNSILFARKKLVASLHA